MTNSNFLVESKTIPNSFFPTLRNLAFLSFGLLIGATIFRQSPWIATIGGLAPLIWYHIGYLAPRARAGLGQAAIDSVYYFGFLVTIAALGVSAVALAFGGGKSLETIAYQFGLGLLATGYAVFARMHLASISTWVDEQSPENILDRYVKRTQELVMNVEMASVQFSSLTSNLITRTEAVTNHATETTEKTMLALAKNFDEQLRATLASGNQGLNDLRALVNETSFTEERQALARSVKITLEVILHLNKALLDLTARSSESVSSSEAFRSSSDSLAESISQLSQRINQIAGENGTIIRTVHVFDDVQSRTVRATEALDGVVQDLVDVGGALGGVGVTFKNLKLLTTKAQSQLDAMIISSDQLSQATKHISNSAQKTEEFASSIDRVVATLPKMERHIQALDEPLEKLRSTAEALESHLRVLPKPADEVISLANNLKQALGDVHKVWIAANSESDLLVKNTAQHMEKSHQLAVNIATLQDLGKGLNDALDSISISALRAGESLDKSTSSLQKTLEITTNALESDVRISSRAASLFSEKLSEVAQNIINETRKVRSS